MFYIFTVKFVQGQMEINERASTSVECPLSPTEPGNAVGDEVRRRAAEAASKLYSYIHGQMQTTVDEYKLLQDINVKTVQRYIDMEELTNTISSRLTGLQTKYEQMRPILEQINEIEEASRRLETAVATLEGYLDALEAKLRTLQRQNMTI